MNSQIAKNRDRKKTLIGMPARSTVLVILVLVFLVLLVEITLSRFSIASLSEAKKETQEIISGDTEKKASELSLVMNDMMNAGCVAASFLSQKDDDIFNREYLDIVADNNFNTYAAALVDTEGKGICSVKENIDIEGSDYFFASNTPYYSFTNDDLIDSKTALTCVIPIVKNDEPFAYLIQYIDISILEKYIPIEGGNRDNSVLIINSDGDRIYSTGRPWIIVGSNLYDTLSGLTIEDTQIDKIKVNVENKQKQKFVASNGKNSCLLVTVPAGETGWTLVDMVDMDSYVNGMILSKSSGDTTLAKRLAFFTLLAVGIFVAIFIRYRYNYAKTSKDLENKADSDLLTGLNNKMTTERKIDECLDNENDTRHMMLLFDIDNFKKINDTMGHAFGDQVLKTLGEQLSQEFRKTDILGRLGGDEFVILLRDIKTQDVIEMEADKILNFFKNFKVGDYVKYSATASIGVSMYPEDGKSFQELYKAADNALYEAKKQGKNRLIYYNKDMASNTEKRDKEAKDHPGLR